MFDNQGLLNNYDVIVLGTGISGLTSALIFAKEGKKVALFERDQDIAPLIRPYYRKGCQFSPGLHISGWMDQKEIISTFLQYLDVADGVEIKLHDNGFGNVEVDTKRCHFPKGLDGVEKSLLACFPESAEAIHHYIKLIKTENQQSFFFNEQITPGYNKNYQFSSFTGFTLKDCLNQYHASPDLIDLLGAINYILIGSKADEVPFINHAFVLGGFYRSPGFFSVSGLNQLLANFKREFKKYQVDLFLGSEAIEILEGTHRNVIGIETLNGNRYYSPQVIVSFNPKLLNDIIKQPFRPVYRQRLKEAENSCGLFVAIYQVTEEQFNIENFVYYDRKLNLTLAATTNYDNGQLILCVFLADNSPSLPVEKEVRKNLAVEKIQLIEKVIFDKIPLLKGKTILLDFLKPWSFERYTKTVNGSAYGLKKTIQSIGFQYKVPIKGLYLVGQAIYPGFLGAMISSFGLACELFEADQFWSKVKKNGVE